MPRPELQLARELEVIINTSSDGIWVCDGKANVLRINPASERINNIKAERVRGKNMRKLTQAGIVDHSVTLEVLKHKKAITILQTTKDLKKLLVTGTPVFDEHDTIVRVVVNERDISEFERLKNELLSEKAKQQELSSRLNELQAIESTAEKLIVKSENMQAVLKTACKIAPTEATVMLLGETGTGKGLMADFLHQHSNRREKPIIKINCGALPESLIESELFGYEPGAFTGALSNGQTGKFELSHTGTLFLDEIGDLPQSAQVKILHFLEGGQIYRVGGRTPLQLDIRIIAATNKDLNELMNEHNFREDLFYRLNVIPLHLPPLRERKECLFPLLQKYLHEFTLKLNKEPAPRLSAQAVNILMDYSYPGNVRELINTCERLVALADNEWVNEELVTEIVQQGPGKGNQKMTREGK